MDKRKNIAPSYLFIRLDKIGDLICTLPCDDHPQFPKDSKKFWVIAKGNEFIANNCVPPKNFLALDKKETWKSFFTFLKFLKNNSIDVAFSFQAPWWANAALFLAKVPLRYGVLSQWHSFLFLNKGLRQKRSLAQKHEADYNFEIVDKAFSANNISDSLSKYSTPIQKIDIAENPFLLHRFHLQDKKYIVIHPGMAGSSLNWPQEKYIELINKILIQTDRQIVITGTPMDEVYLSQIKNTFKSHPRVILLQSKITTEELLVVLKCAYSVLAPSTGVLHLSASLGNKTVGIFSPIRVQHPTRWQARGAQVKNFHPYVTCPAPFDCLREKCPHYNCMDQIDSSEILKELI